MVYDRPLIQIVLALALILPFPDQQEPLPVCEVKGIINDQTVSVKDLKKPAEYYIVKVHAGKWKGVVFSTRPSLDKATKDCVKWLKEYEKHFKEKH